MWQKNSVIVESGLPLGSSAEGAPPMVAGHTSMESAYAFASIDADLRA